jgi:hypothetical protein
MPNSGKVQFIRLDRLIIEEDKNKNISPVGCVEAQPPLLHAKPCASCQLLYASELTNRSVLLFYIIIRSFKVNAPHLSNRITCH